MRPFTDQSSVCNIQFIMPGIYSGVHVCVENTVEYELRVYIHGCMADRCPGMMLAGGA